MQKISFFLLLCFVLTASLSYANGLLRTIWSCNVPCLTKDTHETLKDIQVAYCSVSSLSEKMIEDLNSVCQKQNNRADAIAMRTSKTQYATCASSSNTCPTEGLTTAGFTCSYMCPAEDNVVRKFTACASTGLEAWSYATSVCKGAIPPDKSIYAATDLCTADGQTPCPTP